MKIRNIKEIISDERTNKVVKTLVVLNCIRVAGKLVYYTARYGPKTVERVKNKISEHKKQNEERKKFDTIEKMYRDIGAEGINNYVKDHEYEFILIENLKQRLG